jgi:hypothetical protein
MIDNAEAIPRRESNLDRSAVQVGNPSIVRLPYRFAKSVPPLVPVLRIGEEIVDLVEMTADTTGDRSRFDSCNR